MSWAQKSRTFFKKLVGKGSGQPVGGLSCVTVSTIVLSMALNHIIIATIPINKHGVNPTFMLKAQTLTARLLLSIFVNEK